MVYIALRMIAECSSQSVTRSYA